MASTTMTEQGTSTWVLDPTHSSVEFAAKHMMMTTVRGRFKDVTATVTGPPGSVFSRTETAPPLPSANCRC